MRRVWKGLREPEHVHRGYVPVHRAGDDMRRGLHRNEQRSRELRRVWHGVSCAPERGARMRGRRLRRRDVSDRMGELQRPRPGRM